MQIIKVSKKQSLSDSNHENPVFCLTIESTCGFRFQKIQPQSPLRLFLRNVKKM